MTSRGELSTGGDRSQRIGPEVLAEAEHQTVIGWLRCRAFRCGFGLVLIWVSVIASGSRDALLGQNNVPSANEQPNPQPLAAIQIESHLGSKVLTQLNLVPWLPLSLPGLSVSPLDSQNGSLHPRSLTSGDISGDGLPDLISGFSALEGGQISVHLANRESLYPQSPGAYQRIREGTFKEPFFQAQPLIFELPISPDFLLAGDFDGDLHADVLIGSRDEAAIYLLSNDGQGGLIPPKIRPLPGRPTSLISGEINRRDGVTDFVVAVTGETPDGSTAHQLLVFEHPEGAWQTPDPEVLPMDEAASSLSLALVDPDGWVDVAVAHGNQVTIFHGRDRRLTGEPKIQLAVPPAESSVFSFAWQAVAVQAADLSGDTSRELAVLLAGGQLEVLTWDRERIRQQTVLTADGDQGIRAGLESETLGAAQLLAVRMTGQEKEDLVLLDRARSAQLLFVRSDQIETQGAGRQPMGRVELLSFFQPRAVVPMRLNFDGSTDLIFLSDQAPYLAAITTGLGASFTITSSGEEDDGDLTDNKCAAEPCVEGNCTGPCSWLGAVKQANASGGATITFAVDRVVQPAGGMAIPDINVRVEILGDPNDRPKFISEICTSAFFGVGLLKLNGAESVVRNIEVIGDSVRLRGAGSTVEGSRLALQPLDEIFFLDCPKGLISDAADNTIGGAAAEARNLIAADGLSVLNVGAQVENNWVGLDESGQVAIENQGLSVQGSGHQIKNNVISGVQGLGFFGTPLAAIGVSCSGCAIQGNRVGTNHDGSQLLGNQGWGVLVSSEEGEATNTIGGTLPGLGNIVAGTRAHPDSEFEAFQTGSGIVTLGGLVQGNRIGTDATGTKSGFGNETNGVFVFPGAEVPNLLIGGLVQGAANLISGNGGHGVKLGVLLTGDPVRIQGNYIGIELPASGTSLDPEQARRLPNEKAGVEIGSNGHLVGGEDDRAGNTIAFNRQGGGADSCRKCS